MEKMNNLKDLLKHELQDLHSAEDQIIAALPAMIEKATNTSLKNSLREHLRVTEKQKNRVVQILQLLGEENAENGRKKKGIAGLFGGAQKCKGMAGIIDEGKKIMSEKMHPDVMDAAIIASAQKVEHYEICGYGTARSYAEELGLQKVAELLEQTLNEEYEADDKLTFLAESRINRQAEKGGRTKTGSESTRGTAGRETTRDFVKRRELEAEPVSARRAAENAVSPGSRSERQPRKGSGTSKKSAPSKSNSKTSRESTGRRGNGSGRSR